MKVTEEEFYIYEDAALKFGKTHQIIVAIEELSELIKALTKLSRRDHDDDEEELRDSLVEELADNRIVTKQIEIMYGIQEYEIEEVEREKIKRLGERVKW